MDYCCPLTQIRYQLKRSAKRRSIGLKISRDGLIVSAPSHLSQSEIDRCIFEKQHWINRHLAKQTQLPVINYLEARRLPFLDDELILRVVVDTYSAVTLEGNTLWVQLSKRILPENHPRQLEQLVTTWFQQQALAWFDQRINYWQTIFKIGPSRLEIKQWQRKWGTCDSNGIIRLNWRLLLAPAWVADYVVVHEMAHLKQLNHSAKFWQLIATNYPRFKEAEAYLRDHQQQLFLSAS